jgi:hypothetical protein
LRLVVNIYTLNSLTDKREKISQEYGTCIIVYIPQMCQPPILVQSHMDPFVTNQQHLIKVHYKFLT